MILDRLSDYLYRRRMARQRAENKQNPNATWHDSTVIWLDPADAWQDAARSWRDAAKSWRDLAVIYKENAELRRHNAEKDEIIKNLRQQLGEQET